jgi:hypothetical protein
LIAESRGHFDAVDYVSAQGCRHRLETGIDRALSASGNSPAQNVFRFPVVRAKFDEPSDRSIARNRYEVIASVVGRIWRFSHDLSVV